MCEIKFLKQITGAKSELRKRIRTHSILSKRHAIIPRSDISRRVARTMRIVSTN